ncbi:MAG: phenylacetate--CoA ligase family protein [Gammaproteobacteria bacterium]|nr:phenylacetate--CoA ligase family protein [Gammaproteobacteria bacterium]
MTRIDRHIPRSIVSGIGWPAMPDANAAGMLALQQQLAQSQWWSPETLYAQQQAQLAQVLTHALDTIPAYAQRFRAAGLALRTPALLEAWQAVPLLARRELRSAGETFMSRKVPPAHGSLSKVQTSGSTGTPITAYGTKVTALFWRAFTLREHLWQRRDLGGRFAAIRPEGTLQPGRGQRAVGWGPATDAVYATGESFALSSRTDIPTQAAWLQEVRPDYLLSLPSNLIALARHCRERGIALPNLREVRSYGEVAGDELRQTCRAVWGVAVKDAYSAQEVGYMALQCPEHEHYHVMSEGVLLEVLDTAGHACAPGEIGRVVVTTLHNFAMPLIRYEIGDYAEVGAPCACGRGLPVIARVLGRHRNMLTFPDGRQAYPSFPAELWDDIAPIRQLQLVQTALTQIMARLVVARPLTAQETDTFASRLQARLGYPFVIELRYQEDIPRSAGGKYEDFISEVASAGGAGA